MLRKVQIWVSSLKLKEKSVFHVPFRVTHNRQYWETTTKLYLLSKLIGKMGQVDIKGHLSICYNVSSFIPPSPILLWLTVSKFKNSEGHMGDCSPAMPQGCDQVCGFQFWKQPCVKYHYVLASVTTQCSS